MTLTLTHIILIIVAFFTGCILIVLCFCGIIYKVNKIVKENLAKAETENQESEEEEEEVENNRNPFSIHSDKWDKLPGMPNKGCEYLIEIIFII